MVGGVGPSILLDMRIWAKKRKGREGRRERQRLERGLEGSRRDKDGMEAAEPEQCQIGADDYAVRVLGQRLAKSSSTFTSPHDEQEQATATTKY